MVRGRTALTNGVTACFSPIRWMAAPGREPVSRRSSGTGADSVEGAARPGRLQAASRARLQRRRTQTGDLTPNPFSVKEGEKEKILLPFPRGKVLRIRLRA